MGAQKQSLPSFASILSVLSIVFFCAGFLRVELELNDQKNRISTLESVAAETKPSSHVPDIEELTKNAQEFESIKRPRNKRQVDSVRNTTEAKGTLDTVAILKITKLLSELKPHLCHAKGDTCPPGPPGSPGPRGEKGSQGQRGQIGKTGNKGDQGIMGSPGKRGKQGIMGPVGPKGETGLVGQKGNTGNKGDRGILGLRGKRGRQGLEGKAGNKGQKGEPGESISVPVVAVSTRTLTVYEGESTSFQCSVSGNPAPAIAWKKLDNQSEISQSAVSRGKLVLKNVSRSDSGTYICSAVNILGQAEDRVQLVVNQVPVDLAGSSILGSLDSKYLDKLKSYLDPVLQSRSRSRFVRCWHAKTDGWAASTFHSNCDGKGPTVTIVQVRKYIFGGYVGVSWGGSCDYLESSDAFLYSLYNIRGYDPVKLTVLQSMFRMAVKTCSSHGPWFGYGVDLYISNNASSNQKSFTHCGWSYPLPSGYSNVGSYCTFYAGTFKFTPTNIEVFYETTT